MAATMTTPLPAEHDMGGDSSRDFEPAVEQMKVEDPTNHQDSPVFKAHKSLFIWTLLLWFFSLGALSIGIALWVQAPRHIAFAAAIYNCIMFISHFPCMGPISRQKSPTDPRPQLLYRIFVPVAFVMWLANFALLTAQYTLNDNVQGDKYTRRKRDWFHNGIPQDNGENHRDTPLAHIAIAGMVLSLLACGGVLRLLWQIRVLSVNKFTEEDVYRNYKRGSFFSFNNSHEAQSKYLGRRIYARDVSREARLARGEPR